jgi:hypothetical protein
VFRSLTGNRIGPAGERAIAEAIAANQDTAMFVLSGFDLKEHLHVLGVSDEMRRKSNREILAHIRARHRAHRAKSARGGAK